MVRMAFLKDDDNLDDSVVVVPLHEEGASDAIEALEGLHFLAKKGKRSESRVWAPIKKCALELANAAASPATGGDVRVAYDVTVKMLPCRSSPPRLLFLSSWIRRKRLPYTCGIP